MARVTELYAKLTELLARPDQLVLSKYPQQDPNDRNLMKAPDGYELKPLASYSELNCDRCWKIYPIDSQGRPLDTSDTCRAHTGHLISTPQFEKWTCCGKSSRGPGCYTNRYHVNDGDYILENYIGFVSTKPHNQEGGDSSVGNLIFALDCEMCYTTVGKELIRVTVLNYKYDVVYDKLVKPLRPILDYNTKWSGITEADLKDVTRTLGDVQRDLLELFSDKTILIGHGLDHDMKALKIFHQRFVDTAILFVHRKGLPHKRSLKSLMQQVFKEDIQRSRGHDSLEDAKAALRLVLHKIEL